MILLAPMQGLTEVLFRRTYESCFPGVIDAAVSPFLSLTHGNLADAWKKISDVLPENNEGSMAVIPQILGKESDEFVALANRLAEVGYKEVNWNIGCPMRRVAGKHRGSGILPYPDEVERVLNEVVPRLEGIELSVKMRLGYVSRDEIFALIPILNNYPLKSVTIHPRIGKQQYGGSVDLDTFEKASKQIRHKVIYNGDICTLGDYRTLRNRFPEVSDVMIGRGVLYDPLLPVEIKGQTGTQSDRLRFIAALKDSIVNTTVSDEAKQRKLKEYWCLLWKATGVSESEARKVLHTTTLAEAIDAIETKCLMSNVEGRRP